MVCDTCKHGPKNNEFGNLCTDDCTNFGGYTAIEGITKLCSNCGSTRIEDGVCIRAVSCLKEDKSHWIPNC